MLVNEIVAFQDWTKANLGILLEGKELQNTIQMLRTSQSNPLKFVFNTRQIAYRTDEGFLTEEQWRYKQTLVAAKALSLENSPKYHRKPNSRTIYEGYDKTKYGRK